MVRSVRVKIEETDHLLTRYGNQLGALGAGKARQAMARAVNHTGRKAYTRVVRDLVRQTSAPRAIVKAAVKTRAAAHKGGGPIEFVIYSTGSELPLKMFRPRQFSFGVRAKVWGRMQRFDSMFGAPGDSPAVIAALNGHIFHRTGASRLPIEKAYGPSIPKEMLLGKTAEGFQEVGRWELERRLRHEIERLLPT